MYVRDLMTTEVVTVRPSAVGWWGILARTDIVRAYARTDDDLLQAVANAVRAVDGRRLVSVDEGVARLAGTVASEPLAHAIFVVVRGIDGIVAVDDRDVSWLETHDTKQVPGVDRRRARDGARLAG